MKTNERKVDNYERKLYRLAVRENYGHYLLTPSSLDYCFRDEDETENVWVELRAQLNKTKNKYTDFIQDRMLLLLNSRLYYLRGSYYDFISTEEKNKYISNINEYPKFFSEKTIQSVLKQTDIRGFMEQQEVYGNFQYYQEKGYYELGTCEHEVAEKDIRGRVTGRKIKEYGKVLLLPSATQINETKFLQLCMELEYPYIKKYTLSYYHLDKASEFYINVKGKGFLYVPIICFKTHNIQPAIDRMTEYFNWYYKDTEQLKKQLALMKTDVFKQLQRDIERGKMK